MRLDLVQFDDKQTATIVKAVERDLRKIILLHLTSQSCREVLGGDLYKKCCDRILKETPKVDTVIFDDLEEMILYTDMGDLFQIINSDSVNIPKNIRRHIKENTSKLEKLIPIRNRIAHDRPLLFGDPSTAKDIALYFMGSADYSWNTLKEVLDEIGESLNAQTNTIMHNLPTPDYLETGLIGRKKQTSSLLKTIIQTGYPVISIIGEGGLGKSALAVKVAYEIATLPNCPFDDIVWVTAKTHQLNTYEIEKIKDAIEDSLTLFQKISVNLTNSPDLTPLENILEHLRELRILLILDNLETVLDQQMKDFLENIPTGSKVLITSRIGLGELGTLKLTSIETSDSVQLLRALAQFRQISALAQLSTKQVESYCIKMRNNPLFIKWFVNAVQAGQRPERILENKELILNYCMHNVYESLSKGSKQIIGSMLVLPGKKTLAEIAYYNREIPLYEIEEALLQLTKTTMISMATYPNGNAFESVYQLSEFTRDYLASNHIIKRDEEANWIKLQRQFQRILEQVSAENRTNPYSMLSIQWKSKGEYIVAKQLFDAIADVKKGLFDDAKQKIANARILAPHFFEVYRVEAYMCYELKYYTDAHTAYETAIGINPLSVPLRLWFGTFLQKEGNYDDAINQFQEGLKLDRTFTKLKIELTRSYLITRRFDEARSLLDELINESDQLSQRYKKMIADVNLQFHSRRAEYLRSQRDAFGALEELEKMKSLYISYPPTIIDRLMKERLSRATYAAKYCMNTLDGIEYQQRSSSLLAWLDFHGIPNTEEGTDDTSDMVIRDIKEESEM